MNASAATATGLLPRRLKDVEDAFWAMEIDGAAIVELDAIGPDAAVDATQQILGDRLQAFRPPVGIITNPVSGEGPHPDAARRNVLSDRSVELGLHIDGFMQFGTSYPDYFFLLCAEQAPQGGESFGVDGVRLVDRLAEQAEMRELVDFLWRVRIDQSTPTGVEHHAPIASRTRAGRATARRHWAQRLLDHDSDDPVLAGLLARWAALTEAAGRAAPRFLLKPGDLLCIDNYRIFHGREPYDGLGRTLHRVWTWTDQAFGVPDDLVGGRR